jgi:hypothetical protein
VSPQSLSTVRLKLTQRDYLSNQLRELIDSLPAGVMSDNYQVKPDEDSSSPWKRSLLVQSTLRFSFSFSPSSYILHY